MDGINRQRNYNIDILRGLFMLLIVVYHSWVQCGSVPFRSGLFTKLISLGGEVGVTAFFALSGYGIYCSLYRSSGRGECKFLPFMKKRLQRILPSYYLCLLVVFLFTDGAIYLQLGHVDTILTHVFLVHNLVPEHFGAINGVLWTLGVIFQFYLIAILLFKGFQKCGGWMYVVTVILTIVSKAFVYSRILSGLADGSSMYFFAGRQVLTALDNFTVGMLVAHLIVNKKKTPGTLIGVAGTLLSLALLVGACVFGLSSGIHTNNLSGYTWHSLVALLIGSLMWMFGGIAIPKENPLVKGVLWIAKYEYGIYLWHLVMINTCITKAPFISQLLTAGYRKSVYLLFGVLSVITGYVMSKAAEGLPNRKEKRTL